MVTKVSSYVIGITEELILTEDPTVPLGAATKQYVDGLTGVIGLPKYIVVTEDFTADVNRAYITNLALASTCVLPLSPSDGDTIEVMDGTGTFDINNLTVERNGSKIQGQDSDLVLNVANSALKLVYISALGDWRIANRYIDF